MANADRPSGLTPVRYLNGTPWNGACTQYHVDSADTSVIAVGDPVKLDGSAHTNGIASVTLGTAAATAVGVVVAIGSVAGESVYFDPASPGVRVIPATKTQDYYVAVVDDPNVVFEIQEVSGGTALTSAAVGLNADFVAGTDNGYVSAFELNNVGEATTSTLNLKLLGLARKPDNAFGEHAKWLVLLNNHSFRTGVTGV